MKAFIAFSAIRLTDSGSELLSIPNANFIRCLNSGGRRFLISIDGDPAVPCWGGWYWKVAPGESVTRLKVMLLPDDTEPLDVEFMHGLGSFDDKQLQLVNEYAAASQIRIAQPTTVEESSLTADGTVTFGRVFDSDPSVQEIIFRVPKWEYSGMGIADVASIFVHLYSGDPSNNGVLLCQFDTKSAADMDPQPIQEIQEFRLNYAGELWIYVSDSVDGFSGHGSIIRLKL